MMSTLDAGSTSGRDAFGAALDAIDVVAALANRILSAPSEQPVDDVQRAALDQGLGNTQDAIVLFIRTAMHNVEFSTEFESVAAALTAAPSNTDLWLAIDWVARGVAAAPVEYKRVAARGVLVGLLSVLPPAPAGRRAVFYAPGPRVTRTRTARVAS